MAQNTEPFIKKYCINCHNQEEEKGGLRLDNINYSVSEHSDVYIWQDVLEALNGGEMPPEDEGQPHREELKSAIATISEYLHESKKRLASTGGVIKMRHLNKREYYGSIKDLFGHEPPDDYLFDDVTPSFDTNGNDQFFTSASLENYLEMGEKIVYANLTSYSKAIKESSSQREVPGPKIYKSMERKLKVALETKKKIEGGATYKEMGFKDEGRLILEKRRYPNAIEIAKTYLEKPEHKFGTTGLTGMRASVEAGKHYKIMIRAGRLTKTSTPIEINLKVMSKDYGTVKLKPIGDKNQVVEAFYKSNITSNRARIMATLLSESGAYIESLEIAPVKNKEPSFAENLFRPILSEENISIEKASLAVKTFAERAFRYQPGNEDFIHSVADRLKEYQDLDKGKAIKKLAKSLALILASPSFLYIAEKNNGSREILDQKEYAVRLSYFLWASPPDEELYNIAKSGQLYNQEVLRTQFERMISSAKANDFLTSFINQWAEMRRFDQIDLPEEYEGSFRQSARSELSEFFKVLVHENLPVDKFISSDFTVLNHTLAEHYSLTDDFKDLDHHFQKVNLKPHHNRGGFLNQAAFLITGTSGERTSPTIRGALIRKTILNDPPLEPPANVPEIEETKEGVVSVKELVEHHKSLAQCASCHDKIDPIGLGLENYDRFGKWREVEALRVGPKKRRNMRYKKVPLHTSGYISKSEKFDNFQGLQDVLLKNKDKLAKSLYTSMLSYGIGRGIEFVDEEEVHNNLQLLSQDNFLTREMLFSVVSSQAFRTK